MSIYFRQMDPIIPRPPDSDDLSLFTNTSLEARIARLEKEIKELREIINILWKGPAPPSIFPPIGIPRPRFDPIMYNKNPQ